MRFQGEISASPDNRIKSGKMPAMLRFGFKVLYFGHVRVDNENVSWKLETEIEASHRTKQSWDEIAGNCVIE